MSHQKSQLWHQILYFTSTNYTCVTGFLYFKSSSHTCVTSCSTLHQPFTPVLPFSLPYPNQPHLSCQFHNLESKSTPELQAPLPCINRSISITCDFAFTPASARERKVPGSNPACAGIFFRGPVISMTSKLALQWLPCQAPVVMGSALGLVGPVSVYCDWVR